MTIKGYPLPTRDNPERISNKDVKSMTQEELVQEKANLTSANEGVSLLKEQGLSVINIPKKRGATVWDEWYEARIKAINKGLENE